MKNLLQFAKDHLPHPSEETRHRREQRRAIRRAEAELRGYSDEELHDIGITRSEIAYVVRHGRGGLDAPLRKAG